MKAEKNEDKWINFGHFFKFIYFERERERENETGRSRET